MKNILVLCASERSIQNRIAEKWLNTVLEEKEDYDLYYVGLDLRTGSNKCVSKINDLLTRCKNMIHPNRKYDIIISESCPYKQTKKAETIYDTSLKQLLNHSLKKDGYYITNGDSKKSRDLMIDDIQERDILLSKWLGKEYMFWDEGLVDNARILVFRKR
jgi:hypothetical protein